MCRCPTRGDTLRAAAPPTGKMRKLSTRYGIKTTPWASGPGSGGSTISVGAGSSMGTTVLWAKAPMASTVPAAIVASVLMSRFIAFSPWRLAAGGIVRRRMTRTSGAPSTDDLELPQRFECSAHLVHKELRLLPGRKVRAFGEPVVVDELGIRLLSPTLRCLVDLFAESAHGDRDLDAPHIKEAAGRKIMPRVPVEAC